MSAIELNTTYINVKPLERIITPKYNLRDDLQRVRHNLEWSLHVNGPQLFFKTTPENEAKQVSSWYESRLAEIAREEQAVRQRLEQARISGAIDASDYSRAVMDLMSPLNEFERAKREAQEAYFKHRKVA